MPALAGAGVAVDRQVLGHQRGHRGRRQLCVPEHQVPRDRAAGQADRADRPAPVGRRVVTSPGRAVPGQSGVAGLGGLSGLGGAGTGLRGTAPDPGAFQRQLPGDRAAAQQQGALPASARRPEVPARGGVPGQAEVAANGKAVRDQRGAAPVDQPGAAHHEVSADLGPGQLDGRLAGRAAVRIETVHEHADAGAAITHGQARSAEGRAGAVDEAGGVQPEFAGHLGAGQLDQAVRAVPVEFAATNAQRVNPGPVRRDRGHHAGIQEKPRQLRVGQVQGFLEAASGKPQPDGGAHAFQIELTANQYTADHDAAGVDQLRWFGPIGTGEDIPDAARVEGPAAAQAPDLVQAKRDKLAAVI